MPRAIKLRRSNFRVQMGTKVHSVLPTALTLLRRPTSSLLASRLMSISNSGLDTLKDVVSFLTKIKHTASSMAGSNGTVWHYMIPMGGRILSGNFSLRDYEKHLVHQESRGYMRDTGQN